MQGLAATGVRFLVLALVLALAPPRARAASITIEGGAVVLGRTESVPVVIRVAEVPGTEDRPLRLAVNVGSFSEPTKIGKGTYRAIYIPPSTRFPQLGLVAVWKETGPEAQLDFLRFPLFGTTRIAVTTKRGAEVRAKLGFDDFGPVNSDATGKAALKVAVPPEVLSADLTITERSGASVKKTVPVSVPPYNRLTAALVPHAVVADGNGWVRLDVLYALGGASVPADRIHVVPSVGTANIQSAQGGLYTYRYVPPAGTRAGEVTFRITVDGDPVAKAAARLSIGLPPPARLQLRPPAVALEAGTGETAPVSLLVMDATGLGLGDQRPEITANGVPVTPIIYKGAGIYETLYRAPDAYPAGGLVQFFASVQGPKGSPIASTVNYQLKAAPRPGAVGARFEPSPVPVGGATEARLQLDVRDLAGLPLAKAQLITVVSAGSLGKLEERAPGVYVATYNPPATLPDGDATLRVLDANGGFEQTEPLPLRQVPPRLLVGASAGWAQSPGDAAGLRVGLDAWVPFRLGPANLAAGAAASWGMASRSVSDPTGTLTSRSTASFFPLSLQLALEALTGRRVSLSLGAGAVAAMGSFENTLGGPAQTGWGLGGMGFVTGAWTMWRGQLFLELSYARVPVETPDFRLDAGGPRAALGYRLGVL
ncbi:MAG: hypothetical protein WCC48_16415 [Anaeromyxobacteraceae bacterium]